MIRFIKRFINLFTDRYLVVLPDMNKLDPNDIIIFKVPSDTSYNSEFFRTVSDFFETYNKKNNSDLKFMVFSGDVEIKAIGK